MGVDEALDTYHGFGNEIFGKARIWNERSIPPFWLPRAKYASKKTRAVIKKIIYDKLAQYDKGLMPHHIESIPLRYRSDRTRAYVLLAVFAFVVTLAHLLRFHQSLTRILALYFLS